MVSGQYNPAGVFDRESNVFNSKSQLAIEYAFRVRDRSQDTWVFWIHAGSTARILEGYRNIAERLKLPVDGQDDTDLLLRVHNWLSAEKNGHWLMIIDNADDFSAFSFITGENDNASDNLTRFLPRSQKGSILITSRSRAVAFRLTGATEHLITVERMNPIEAVQLLKQKLKSILNQDHQPESTRDQSDMEALVFELDYMPLAVAQAAAYIGQRAPRFTLSTYLQRLKRRDPDIKIQI